MPNILYLDIELKPIKALLWGTFKQNVALNQVMEDWSIISWAAIWNDDPPSKMIYQDQRKSKNLMGDKIILHKIWQLMDKADIIVGQNSIRFDKKKLNSRFIMNKMKPPAPARHEDTFRIAKRHFGFTFNSLEALCEYLDVKYKKQKSKIFIGMELWIECMKGNKKAWNEMKKYNCYDVLATRECYKALRPWDNSINFSVFSDGTKNVCACGSDRFLKNGTTSSNNGIYQRYQCKDCGAPFQSKLNKLSQEKIKSLRKPSKR